MSKILEKLADQHEERMINVLYKLEEDIIKEVNTATKGQLVSQRIAIQLQPKIRQAIENNFLNEADLIINEEYNKIAKEVLDTYGELPIANKFKSLTEANLSTINALKYQSYSGFEDIGERFIKVINDELYQSTIAGRPYEDMVSNIRGHINGVYKKSNQREINELVDYINENKFDATKKLQVEDAVRKLHTQYASDRAGNNLRRYAGQIAHDSVMQFHGQFTIAKAKESGLTHFTYTGTLVRDSRDWCRGILGKTYTEKQIRELWNTRSWNGKSNGDPFIVRGGYRCRHTWIPTDPAWGKETLDELPEEPVIDTPPVANNLEILTSSPANPTLIYSNLPKKKRSAVEKELNERTQRVIPEYTDIDAKIQDGFDDYYTQYGTRFHDKQKNSMFEKRTYRNSLKGLEPDTAVVVREVIKELDELAERFKVPKLNGFYTGKSQDTIASMGDGVMFLNYDYFNMYVKKAKGRKFEKSAEDIAKEKELNDIIDGFIVERRKLLKEGQEKFNMVRKQYGLELLKDSNGNELPLFPKEYYDWLKKGVSINTKEKRRRTELSKLLGKNRPPLPPKVSKWKRGDDPTKRPHNSDEYFDDGIDQLRSTMYHEFGHHIHHIAFIEKVDDYIKPRLEKDLRKLKGIEINIERGAPTRYGDKNSKEWFTENFAVYFLGKKELADPDFIKLIEDILKEVN